jgi:outer membrane protein insertion porin family
MTQEKNMSFEEALDREAIVQRVHVNGVVYTKNDLVDGVVRHLFQARTFKEILLYSNVVKEQFNQLNIFKSVDFTIDSSDDVPNGYDIIMDVEESRRLYAKANSTVALNHELQGMVTLATRNTFGRAETVEANVSVGSNAMPTYRVQFTKPLQADRDHNFQIELHRSELEYPWSRYKETANGLHFRYTLPFSVGDHVFGYAIDWRQLICVSDGTPFAVRENAGHCLKSSVEYFFSVDTRNNSVFPDSGSLLKLHTEFAGLGGNIKYIKSDATVQQNVNLPVDSALSFMCSAGLMKWFSRRYITDRFFLGGSQSIRGFSMNSVGPQDEGCAIGSDAYWAAGAHLFTPLPFRPGKGKFGELFRAHFFITGGNCQSLAFGNQWQGSLFQFFSNLRWSYGLGVALKLGPARVEINYCLPQRTTPSDM